MELFTHSNERSQIFVEGPWRQHPLEAKGYVTVGDDHSSRAKSSSDTSDRDSRFGGKHTECGMHVQVDLGFLQTSIDTNSARMLFSLSGGALALFGMWCVYMPHFATRVDGSPGNVFVQLWGLSLTACGSTIFSLRDAAKRTPEKTMEVSFATLGCLLFSVGLTLISIKKGRLRPKRKWLCIMLLQLLMFLGFLMHVADNS